MQSGPQSWTLPWAPASQLTTVTASWCLAKAPEHNPTAPAYLASRPRQALLSRGSPLLILLRRLQSTGHCQAFTEGLLLATVRGASRGVPRVWVPGKPPSEESVALWTTASCPRVRLPCSPSPTGHRPTSLSHLGRRPSPSGHRTLQNPALGFCCSGGAGGDVASSELFLESVFGKLLLDWLQEENSKTPHTAFVPVPLLLSRTEPAVRRDSHSERGSGSRDVGLLLSPRLPVPAQ